jgi:hypothetical protein
VLIRTYGQAQRTQKAVLGVLEQRLPGLLGHVEKLANYSGRMGESSHLAAIVRQLLVPIVGDWQRRSTAIAKDIARLRTRLDAGLNATVDQIALLKDDIQRGFITMKTGIHGIESELCFGVLKNYQLQRNPSEPTKILRKEKIVRRLVLLSILEVSLALVFLLPSLIHEMRRI